LPLMTSASKPSLAATSAEIIPVSLMGHVTLAAPHRAPVTPRRPSPPCAPVSSVRPCAGYMKFLVKPPRDPLLSFQRVAPRQPRAVELRRRQGSAGGQTYWTSRHSPATQSVAGTGGQGEQSAVWP